MANGKISRRDLLKAAGTVPLLSIVVEGAGGAQTVALQPRAVVIGGKSVFLVAGSIDYFRCPHQLWSDRLLRAKRAGLNTIATCVPWNFHETKEGVFEFKGDRDLVRFLDLCAGLGLYAFVRPGPFICDEWEAGGYPAWLIGKPGVQLRANHAPTLRYVRRWFEQLIPQVASRQVTRGGPVVLVQQENEYYYPGRPGVREYQSFLIRTLRELGIDVPITDCNGSDPWVRHPESVQTVNGGGAAAVAALRKTQPDKPVFVSELYTDYMNCWGWPISSYPTAEMLYQQTMETLAAGGMYSYFMFQTGTNFGFWASTTWKSDQSFVTTRYYGRAPVGEGGVLNESYFAAKAAKLLARNFESLLTSGVPAQPPVKLSGPVRVESVRTAEGFLLFVHPRFPVNLSSVYHTDGEGALIQLAEDWPMSELASQPGTLELPSGDRIPIAESSSYPSMLPFALDIASDCRIDYANATLLGITGQSSHRVLLLRGDAGRRGLISVNGARSEFVFPANEPVRIDVGGLTVLALSRAMADRTWFADGRILVGPAYVGESLNGRHECFLDGRSSTIYSISGQGEIAERKVVPAAAVTAQIPLLDWVCHRLPEIQSIEGWRPLDGPRAVEELGADYGYTWYSARFTSQERRTTGLFFTQAADRLHVFVNGKRMGVWGRGPGATRDPLPVELIAGENRFVFLCDNMGRLSEGKCLDRKGICGPVYVDAEVRDLPQPEWSTPRAVPNNSWEYQAFRFIAPKGSLMRATYRIQHREGEGLLLSLRWFPQYAWISVNGQSAGEHAGDVSLASGIDFSSFVLDPYLRPGPLSVEITLFGEPPKAFNKHVNLLAYPKSTSPQNWGFRPWREPSVAADVPRGYPGWWVSDFPKPGVPGPFFLVTQGLSKGQAYLNGHAVGRYWEIGPQHSLYLPEPWFEPRNRVVIFDEEGKSPADTYLMRDSRVPLASVFA